MLQREFDQSNITIDTIKISEDEIVDAKKQVDQSFKNAANETYKRVKIFSELSLKDDWEKENRWWRVYRRTIYSF